jgi:hypothetical protein
MSLFVAGTFDHLHNYSSLIHLKYGQIKKKTKKKVRCK